MIFKMIEKKPYIVGIQISETHAQFISKKIFEKIIKKIHEVIDLKT